VRRNHLATDDLDWLPARYRLLRGAVVSGVWTGLAGAFFGLMWSGAHVVVFGKFFLVLGAAGYWVGDRAAKGLIATRLGKLARGQVDLARLSNEEDGELVHVRGRVRAEQTVAGLVSSQPGVYRRTRVSFAEVQVIDEEAVDFHLVDQEGHAIAIEVAGARLLVQDPKLASTIFPERLLPLASQPSAQAVALRWQKLRAENKRRGLPPIQAGEVMLRAGDMVEAVGYKSRKVDPTVVDRLARETPMRATLRAGKELPVILSVVERAG
jgi:hypothetical protein